MSRADPSGRRESHEASGSGLIQDLTTTLFGPKACTRGCCRASRALVCARQPSHDDEQNAWIADRTRFCKRVAVFLAISHFLNTNQPYGLNTFFLTNREPRSIFRLDVSSTRFLAILVGCCTKVSSRPRKRREKTDKPRRIGPIAPAGRTSCASSRDANPGRRTGRKRDARARRRHRAGTGARSSERRARRSSGVLFPVKSADWI